MYDEVGYEFCDKCCCLTGTLGQLPKQQSVDVCCGVEVGYELCIAVTLIMFYVGANASHACSKAATDEAVAAIDNYKLRL
jgi:hypothetical protein